jgi:hypothetical protein
MWSTGEKNPPDPAFRLQFFAAASPMLFTSE